MGESLQPPFGSRKERVAYNESWARDLNRARAEWQAMGADARFRCECEAGDCDAVFPLTPSEWAYIRALPNRFVVAPDHAAAGDIECVIRRRDRYWIVEKHGEAGEVAEELA